MFSDQKFILFSADDTLEDLLSKNGAKVCLASWEDIDFENQNGAFYVIKDYDDVQSEEFVKKGVRVICIIFFYFLML